jgi:hypothetical protein
VARCCSFVANRTRLLNPGEQNIEKGRLAELNTCWADPSALQCLRKARPRESIEAEIKSQEQCSTWISEIAVKWLLEW